MEQSPIGQSIDGSPEKASDMSAILEEINKSDNLTVKLSSISKIVASLNKGMGSSGSLAKKKMEETLSQTNPDVKKMFDEFKESLKDLQEQKDDAIEDFLAEHMEQRQK